MRVPARALQRISGLPGEELIDPGLRDLAAGRFSSREALLILIARTRLARAGLDFLDSLKMGDQNFESLLFQELYKDDPETAYGRYTSMKRRLDSFIRCLESVA